MGFENGDVWGVRLRASDGTSRECVSVIHYDNDNSGELVNPNNGQDLADALSAALLPVWKPLVPSTWSIDPIVVFDEVDPQDPGRARSEWSSGTLVAGTRSIAGKQFLPFGCAVQYTFRTKHIGRRFRGRMWVPFPMTEDDQQDGDVVSIPVLTDAFIAAIPRQPDAAAGGPSVAVATWSVYSRTQRAQGRDPYLNEITSTKMAKRVRVLRSRMNY